MQLTLEQTEKLLKEDIHFNSLGLSMLATRLRIFHERDPIKHTLEDCRTAINAFLDKYGNAVTKDLEKIK